MNSKWSSLDFPLLGADVQNCKKETGKKKGGGILFIHDDP